MMSLPDFLEKSIIVCNTTEGQTVSFKNDNVLIKDKEGNVILQHSCYRIFSLWIIGNTSITSGILQRSKKFGFSIFLFSYSFRLVGVWNNAAEGNFLLREKQYSYDKLDIALHIVKNKIQNQIQLLKTIRSKTVEQQKAITSINDYLKNIQTETLKELLGIEGITTKVYFSAWFADVQWNGRKPRTKIDKTNTILDIGYTYLFNIMDAMLNLYGFDLYKGVYHQNFYQRKSLVCDLVEPFRCIIDRKVKNAYNMGQIKDEDFDIIKGQYFLKREKSKLYTGWILHEIMNYKKQMFLYVQSYYRSFMRQKPISQYPKFLIKDE